jgi:hypothetical protein
MIRADRGVLQRPAAENDNQRKGGTYCTLLAQHWNRRYIS